MSMIPSITELFDLTQTEHAEIFEGIKYPWEVLPRIAAYITEHSTEAILIGEGTIVEPGSVILGPAIIGKNCVIRSGAYIREQVIIGNNCTIGHASELKNCLLFNEAQVPHLNYLGDSILGWRAHLGAGTILSNVKNTGDEIFIQANSERINTGLQKCGSMIGDEAQIGCNSVINPGSIIGRRSVIYPLVSFRGVLPADSIVKLRQEHEIISKD